MNPSLPFPDDLELTTISRWPTTLPDKTAAVVLDAPVDQRVSSRGVHRRDASIVIVTHNGLVFSRLCLESLLANDSALDFEVVVVDNASTDGTVEYLRALSERDGRVRVECNDQNLGFATATNRGVALASANLLVLLNNDTVPVSPWLDALARHLDDPGIGLVGAVTNRAGNEAEIEVAYRTYGELQQFVQSYQGVHAAELFEIRTATLFCAALRREVWDRVGSLDEQFEVGLFEDDDFSMRVRSAGLRVVCAEDVFVHHFGQASIGQLGPTGAYGTLFHANRARWEAKWGMTWMPYSRRRKPDYDALVGRVRELVVSRVPEGSAVLVISKGDDELLKLGDRRAEHFPQSADGTYAGHHPSDSAACIAELEWRRRRGADFLVIPSPSRWWLDHYREFAEHLNRKYLAVEDGPALIVALNRGEAETRSPQSLPST